MNENQISNIENHNACHAVTEMWTVMYKKQVLWKSIIQFHMQVLEGQSQHFPQSHPKYYALHSKTQN